MDDGDAGLNPLVSVAVSYFRSASGLTVGLPMALTGDLLAIATAVMQAAAALLALILFIHSWVVGLYTSLPPRRRAIHGRAYGGNFRRLSFMGEIVFVALILSIIAIPSGAPSLVYLSLGTLLFAGFWITVIIVGEGLDASKAALYNEAVGVVSRDGSDRARAETTRLLDEQGPDLSPEVEVEVYARQALLRKARPSRWKRVRELVGRRKK